MAPRSRAAARFRAAIQMLLIASMLVSALSVLVLAVESVRVGRLELGEGPVTDRIPETFFGDSIVPEAILAQAGWVSAGLIVWIVVAALLIAVAQRVGR